MFSRIEGSNNSNINQLEMTSNTNGQRLPLDLPAAALRGWPVTVSVEGIGFSYQLTNDDLYKVFSRYGNVTHVDVALPEGSSANVFFAGYEEAARAIASLDGKELAGVQGHLRVAWGQLPTLGASNTADPLRKFTCRFEIGIENDKDFQVARRIIGQKGINMKNIVARTDAKLRLRGRGSGYLEGLGRQESPEPLHLCVSCTSRRGYAEAARLVSDLLERVYDDYRHYCTMNGFPYSSDIRVTIREHPLGSGPYPSFEEPPSGDVPPGIFKPHVTNDFASAASTNATTTPSMLSPTSAGAARFGALIEN
jgi:hypothetical protein